MNRLYYLLGLIVAFVVLEPLTISPCLAAAGKQLPQPARNLDMPDLEHDPGLYFLMGELSEARGDLDAMLRYFRKALDLDPTSAYLNVRIATLLARKRQIAEAIVMARNATLFDPTCDEAFVLLARIYTVTGDLDLATEYYNRALDVKPDERELYVSMGRLQVSRKLFSEAEKTFRKMIEQFPLEKDGYIFLGKVYLEDKRFDEAIKIFEQLREKLPDSAAQVDLELGNIYAVQNRLPQAEQHLREAIKLDQFNMMARLQLAQVLHAQKKLAESFQVLEELSRMAPSHLGIQIRMAQILAEQKQFDKSREILDKVLRTKPAWDEARYHLGRILRAQGKIEEAEQEFLQIRKDQPTYLNSRILMAIMFLKRKELAKSLKYIDESLEVEPRDPDLFQIRGSVLEELHRYEEAIAMYNQALEIDPSNTRIRYSLGNVFEKSGRRERGLAEMERIIQEKPDDAGALNFIGYTLAVMGRDLEKAEKYVRKALSIKPDDGFIIDSVGYVLFIQGKIEEALDHFQRAIEKVKHDPILAEHLGDALAKLGRKEEAAAAYRRSLGDNPDNLVVQDKLKRLEQDLSEKKQ